MDVFSMIDAARFTAISRLNYGVIKYSTYMLFRHASSFIHGSCILGM